MYKLKGSTQGWFTLVRLNYSYKLSHKHKFILTSVNGAIYSQKIYSCIFFCEKACENISKRFDIVSQNYLNNKERPHL